MELIKCSDYVIKHHYPETNEEAERELILIDNFYNKCINYANFLKQPLTLGMFIPCDLDGNVLEEPFNYEYFLKNEKKCRDNYYNSYKKYPESKDRVLFEFPNSDWWVSQLEDCPQIFFLDGIGEEHATYLTIEDLTDLGLTLTPNAQTELTIKQ